jgi:hypothetical protein
MVFTIPSFIGVGDPFVKRRKAKDQRVVGRNFVAVAPKTGKMPDALFEKEFHSLHEGDRFVESQVADRRYQNSKMKKNLTPNGFKCASPPQKAQGLGSYFGTIQRAAFPHETDFLVARKGDVPAKKETKPRQVYTAPGKKGTFGFPNTTIGKEGSDYVASFYGQEREDARKAREAHQKLMKGAAFKVLGRKGKTFDEGPATGVSLCFVMTKPMPIRKQKPVVPKKPLEAPWKPSGPTNQKPPLEYREDPYDKLDPRAKPKSHKKVDSDTKAWKPNSSTDNFWYSTSIAFRGL